MLSPGCKKEQAPRVDIYMLQSFTTTVDNSTIPATVSITNAVLAGAPLVRDEDIESYTRSTANFKLSRDIQSIIKDYSSDKAFAVTVDKQPIYFGIFHPLHLSSMVFGLATIAPTLNPKNELPIRFALIDGNATLLQLDKRNDSRIILSLKATGRLR